MARIGLYMPCILVGFSLWTIGNGLTLMFNRNTGLAVLIVCLIVEGAGIGLTLQPTLVGIYANSRTEDRAVATGLRNFLRTIGGAFGLVISGVVLSNTLSQRLSSDSFVSEGLIADLTSSTYALDDLKLSKDQQDRVLDVYMLGLHYVFVFFTVCTGLCLILTIWVGNKSLKVPKKPVDEEAVSPEAIEGKSPQEDREGRGSSGATEVAKHEKQGC